VLPEFIALLPITLSGRSTDRLARAAQFASRGGA